MGIPESTCTLCPSISILSYLRRPPMSHASIRRYRRQLYRPLLLPHQTSKLFSRYLDIRSQMTKSIAPVSSSGLNGIQSSTPSNRPSLPSTAQTASLQAPPAAAHTGVVHVEGPTEPSSLENKRNRLIALRADFRNAADSDILLQHTQFRISTNAVHNRIPNIGINGAATELPKAVSNVR